MDVGGSGDHRMDDLGFAVDADMGFHAEVPLIPLLGLMHVRIAFPLFVLCR